MSPGGDGNGASIGGLLSAATRRLAAAGSGSARLDARLLLAHALGADDRLHGHEDEPVTPDGAAQFNVLLDRRLAGEPVSRILGNREFWSLEFELSPATLDPRPDSETLIDALRELRPDRSASLRILDLGTGTGCLLLAALSEYPNAEGVGVDIDPECVAISGRNAEKLCLSDRARMIRSSWARDVTGTFDIVLSNPPYIPSPEIENLQPEVRLHDPLRALDGGFDGLDAYRNIAENLASLLNRDGLALFEFGEGQGPEVARIMEAAGLSVAGFRNDLAGIQRCIQVRRN
ncbi:peptide chain release factor N(5)-glutamine methyltransferase [Nisaea acidiphila]|uniref:Release factor glutamine methyltransferase n=1 Tax=Nisaea acidiphila TaxID=1862145 RepID=A0A9J7AXA8_9PROT|nr:peptide chain release factor N(5)-glutamine methyltransferase [Nisaea acidiphila]UUX51426.1 peptide chain release factor N(5)-glutamine methyltransferase [Nisaea acidiphila]